MNLEKFYEIQPYELNKKEKNDIFFDEIKSLTFHHYEKCLGYKKIIDKLNLNINDIDKLEDIPYIPVRLFKEFDLKSVSDEEVFKVMTSSGTSGQAVSKITLRDLSAQAFLTVSISVLMKA